MKITPVNPLQAGVRIDAVKTRASADASGFSTVLAQQLKQAGQKPADAQAVLQPTMAAPLIATADSEVRTSAGSLLSAMENYQQLLADERVSLREVAPAVEQMKEEADSLAALVEGWAEDHPARPAVEQAIATAYQEIVRFDGGEYIAE